MSFANFAFLPSAERPMLVGLLIDVSASMLTSIQNSSGQTQNRLESFKESFRDLVSRGHALSQQGIAGAITPLVKVFAYGFGFGNPLAIFTGDKGPKVRDLLELPGAAASTIPVSELANNWPQYQKHLEQQAFKAFGDTPMLKGLEVIRERFKSEISTGKYSALPILFMLSDGEPTDGSPADVARIANDLKADGILLISCYVTGEDITESRHLYSQPAPHWPSGAKLMFECASALPENSPFDMYLKEYKWHAEAGGRLFTQINQSEILSEFLNLVLSPLQKTEATNAGQTQPEPEQILTPEARQLAAVAPSPEPLKAPEEKTMPIRVFVSYSHQNTKYLEPDSLLGYLSGLTREGFDFWYDERIAASEPWDERIRREIERADIALILVSQPFLNSLYGQEVEITNFLKRRRHSGLRIFPIMLAPSDWKSHGWLVDTQFLPRNGQTVETDYKGKGKRDLLYLEILESLRKLGADIRKERMAKTTKAVAHFIDEFKGN